MADRYPARNPPLRAEVTAEQREALRRARHRRWIASLTDRDWERLARRADDTLAGGQFAKISDLDADIAVYVAHPDNTHPPNGERFGVLRGCPLLGWDLG